MDQKSDSELIPMPSFFGIPEAAMRKNTFFSQFLRKSRRGYFAMFHRDYVRQNIAVSRDGDCHRCGACCKLLYNCPFLGHDSQNLPYCRIYGDLRPGACKNYPFDRVDSEIEQCGFKFK